MNLFDQVSNDIKSAMLAKDKVRLEALRGIKKEFLEAKTAKGADGELPITIAQPIVDITLHFDAELFHLECPLIETGLIPFHIEVTMHVEIEIELIGFLFYTGHLFKEAFIVRHEITF